MYEQRNITKSKTIDSAPRISGIFLAVIFAIAVFALIHPAHPTGNRNTTTFTSR